MSAQPISPGNLTALVKDPRLKGVLQQIVDQANEYVLGLASNHSALASNVDSLSTLQAQTAAQLQASIDAIVTCPVGGEILWPLATPPANFLEEDGAAYSRTTYSDLYGVIGTDYGSGDGSTTFNVPDARGYFVRAWDHGAGNDPDAAARTDRGDGTAGDNVGTLQGDQFRSHNHPYGWDNSYTAYNYAYSGGTSHTDVHYTDNAGGNETRPVNTNRMVIIRYK